MVAKIKIHVALRDWDYLTPLLLGDVTSDLIDLKIDRVGTLVDRLDASSPYQAVEASFSRYVSARVAGDDNLVGIPNFLMRGFRHRCLIVHQTSKITTFKQLAGKRIGVTGWRDSGNSWTRTALFRAGIDVADAFWYAGRLTQNHPITDRLDGFGQKGRIESVPDERSMVDLLREGWLDAVMTPFMPEGFFAPDSEFRHLLPDFRTEEQAYYHDVGYVPGLHILCFERGFARANPQAVIELNRMIDLSKSIWLEKRRKYADTTPWILDDLNHMARTLSSDWDRSTLAANAKMIEDFTAELYRQHITPVALSAEQVFPDSF